jgi:hypothetical protein
MRNGKVTKGLVLGIIMLFIGTSVLSCISGREITESDSNSCNQISYEKTNVNNNLNPPKTLGLTDGLVCYWNFNERRGSIAHDRSGNGNNGYIYGATWTTGKCGSALRIKGRGCVANIPSSYDSSITTAFTVAAWIKWYGAPLYQHGSIIFDGRGGPSTGDGFLFSITGAGKLRLWLNDYNGVSVCTSNYTIPIRTWTFVTGVFDSSSNAMRLYINGDLDNTSTVTQPYTQSGSGVIGNNHFFDGNWAPMNGVEDEVRIYDRPLSQVEITNLYTVLLESSMKGGLGIKLNIKNKGTADASNVEWQIQVKGGMFGLINVNKSGTISTIAKGASTTIRTGMFFGFGKIQITIKIGDEIVTTSGKQFFIFTKIKK